MSIACILYHFVSYSSFEGLPIRNTGGGATLNFEPRRSLSHLQVSRTFGWHRRQLWQQGARGQSNEEDGEKYFVVDGYVHITCGPIAGTPASLGNGRGSSSGSSRDDTGRYSA